MQKSSIFDDFFRRLFFNFRHLYFHVELGPKLDRFRKIFGKNFPENFFSDFAEFWGFLTPEITNLHLSSDLPACPRKLKNLQKFGKIGDFRPRVRPPFYKFTTDFVFFCRNFADFRPVFRGISLSNGEISDPGQKSGFLNILQNTLLLTLFKILKKS